MRIHHFADSTKSGYTYCGVVNNPPALGLSLRPGGTTICPVCDEAWKKRRNEGGKK